MTELRIEDHTMGRGNRVLVVAELGVNHDGEVLRAMEMVTAAAGSGADAVKLQIFRANALMHTSSGFADYQKQRAGAPTPIEMLRKYELATADLVRIVNRIRELKMI